MLWKLKHKSLKYIYKDKILSWTLENTEHEMKLFTSMSLEDAQVLALALVGKITEIRRQQ